MTNNSEYTYANFLTEVMDIAAALPDRERAKRVFKKALDLLNESIPAGNASDATLKRARAIETVLTTDPMTTAEINRALGEHYHPLQVAAAAEYIRDVIITKVIRTTTNSRGLSAQKEYTAYSIH